MTAGAGSTGTGDFVSRFGALAKRVVLNNGVGGETSTQIATRMVAATPFTKSLPTIIWAGRNNYSDATTVKADIASMVAALGHANYLVLSVLNGEDADEYIGGADYATITQLNADLAATYGAHFVDVRSHLVSLYDPNDAQDVIDHNHDIPPASLRSDTLHMNNAGYAVVAALVYANRAQLGLP